MRNLSVALAIVGAVIIGGYADKRLIEGSATTKHVAPACSHTAPRWDGVVTGPRIAASHPTREHNILRLINDYRVAHGLAKLTVSANLGYAARFHSRDMRLRGYFDHGDFETRLARYTPATCIGENLAFGTAGFGTAAGIVSLWRSSSEHREIMLERRFTRVGIGVVEGTFMGQGKAFIATADFSG